MDSAESSAECRGSDVTLIGVGFSVQICWIRARKFQLHHGNSQSSGGWSWFVRNKPPIHSDMHWGAEPRVGLNMVYISHTTGAQSIPRATSTVSSIQPMSPIPPRFKLVMLATRNATIPAPQPNTTPAPHVSRNHHRTVLKTRGPSIAAAAK